MFGIQDYGAFVAAVIVFLAIPGPGNFAVITSTGKGRIRGGLAATFGIIAGDQVLMWLAVAGVAALLKANPAVFAAVQYAGAAYLAWLGFQMLRARPGGAPVLDIQPHHYFRQSLLITLLNPKAIVFYMAFFPLFIDPLRQRGALTLATMAVLIALLSIGWCSVLIFGGQFIARRLAGYPRVGVWLRRAVGVCLVVFGLRLGIAE